MLKLIGAMAIIPLSIIWNGYVLSIVWDWFIVETFKAPNLSIPIAIGIQAIIGFITYKSETTKEKTDETIFLIAVTEAFIVPLFYLGLCYIVYQFV